MGYVLTMLNSYQHGAWWWKSVSIQLEKQFPLWRWPLKEWNYYSIVLFGSTTASFEVGTAQHYFIVYKSRKKIALLLFYLARYRTFTFSFSPFWCLGAVLSQVMAISHYASVSLGYNLRPAKCFQLVVGGDGQEKAGPAMGSVTVRGKWLHDWIYSWTLRQCKSILLLLPAWY